MRLRLQAGPPDAFDLEVAAASALVQMALEPTCDAERIAAFVDRERRSGVDPLRAALLALTDPRMLAAPLDDALSAHVALLCACGGLSAASVWRLGAGMRPQLAASTGPVSTEAPAETISRLARGGGADDAALLLGALGETCALLTWTHGSGERARAQILVQRTAPLLAAAFERAHAGGQEVGRPSRSAERRLTRLALDLHDGPLQDVALLRGELAALHRLLAGRPGAPDIDPLTRIEDLQAIAEAAEADLRELAMSLESTSLARRRLAESLCILVRGFALRSGVEPTLVIEGADDELLPAERGVVLRVVGEALVNAREHASASEVSIVVRVGPASVEATITDDGCGFDVEHGVPDAVRRGRMGVIGMVERARQAGGDCQVASVPGHGTRVSLGFPRQPTTAGAPAVRAAS